MHVDIRTSKQTEEQLVEITFKLEADKADVLSGWPHQVLTLQNLWDILAVYHELGLSQVIPDGEEKRRWQLAGNIVARIQRDNRER